MSEIRRLVIDIGTNSVLALLAGVENRKLSVIFDKKVTTKLGEGLGATGRLSHAAIQRTVAAISESIKGTQYDEIYLLGTEALRIGKNSDEFGIELTNATGLYLKIITGVLEAELSFLGSIYNLDIDKSEMLLIDVGGGSTELVYVNRGEPKEMESVPIGALRLTEISPSNYIDIIYHSATVFLIKKVTPYKIRTHASIVATGGTIVSAAAIAAGLQYFDATRIHGSKLSKDQITKIASDFQNSSPEERKVLIPFDPERADIMLSGLGIYLAILGIIHRDSLVVSTGGLRYGAALYPEKIWA